MPRGKSAQKENAELAAFQELEGALGELERERGIPRQRLLDVLKDAIANAYKRQYGDQATVRIAFSPAGIHVYRQRTVVPDPSTPSSTTAPTEVGEEALAAAQAAGETPTSTPQPVAEAVSSSAQPAVAVEDGSEPHAAAAAGVEVEGQRAAEAASAAVPARPQRGALGPAEITLSLARRLNPNYQVGDVVEEEVPTRAFGRIAAQNAKQLLRNELRQTQDNLIYNELKERVGDIMTGVVQRRDRRDIIIDLGRAEAVLRPLDQVQNENYQPGTRLKVYVTDVMPPTNRGPKIHVSRSHPELVKRLFELEVPEIHDGIVEIKAVAREAGQRAKIAVYSRQPGVDPVGACVGPRGQRVQNVVQELHGEKIDIIPWDPSPERFVAAALEPAEAERVLLRPAERLARVVVADQKLSLAIGRDGQNARLAAKLTGWRIDIKSTSQMAQIVAQELFTPAASRAAAPAEPIPVGSPGVPLGAGELGSSPTPAATGAAGSATESATPPALPPESAINLPPPPAGETAEEEERRRRAREEERAPKRARPRRDKEKEVPITKLLEEDVELDSVVAPPPAAPAPPHKRVTPRVPTPAPEQKPLATTLGALLQQKGAALPLLTPESEEKTPDPAESAQANKKKENGTTPSGGGRC